MAYLAFRWGGLLMILWVLMSIFVFFYPLFGMFGMRGKLAWGAWVLLNICMIYLEDFLVLWPSPPAAR